MKSKMGMTIDGLREMLKSREALLAARVWSFSEYEYMKVNEVYEYQ